MSKSKWDLLGCEEFWESVSIFGQNKQKKRKSLPKSFRPLLHYSKNEYNVMLLTRDVYNDLFIEFSVETQPKVRLRL